MKISPLNIYKNWNSKAWEREGAREEGEKENTLLFAGTLPSANRRRVFSVLRSLSLSRSLCLCWCWVVGSNWSPSLVSSELGSWFESCKISRFICFGSENSVNSSLFAFELNYSVIVRCNRWLKWGFVLWCVMGEGEGGGDCPPNNASLEGVLLPSKKLARQLDFTAFGGVPPEPPQPPPTLPLLPSVRPVWVVYHFLLLLSSCLYFVFCFRWGIWGFWVFEIHEHRFLYFFDFLSASCLNQFEVVNRCFYQGNHGAVCMVWLIFLSVILIHVHSPVFDWNFWISESPCVSPIYFCLLFASSLMNILFISLCSCAVIFTFVLERWYEV